jgi:hypothetical protein
MDTNLTDIVNETDTRFLYCNHTMRLTSSVLYMSSITVNIVLLLTAVIFNGILVHILVHIKTITNTLQLLLINMSVSLILHHVCVLMRLFYFLTYIITAQGKCGVCGLNTPACKEYVDIQSYSKNNCIPGQCRVLNQPQSVFSSNVVYCLFTISIERAYGSYARIGRHRSLDTSKALRPVIYVWVATFILSVLPVLSELIRGDYQSESWQTRIPTCTERYYDNRDKFGTNSTGAQANVQPAQLSGIILLIGFFSFCELVPITIFVLVYFTNTRLLEKFKVDGTHQSLSVRVLLYRNLLATQVCQCVACLFMCQQLITITGLNPINVSTCNYDNVGGILECRLRVHSIR